MSVVASFVFSPFQENTYIIYDESKECAIIDPGCYTPDEKRQLSDFIEAEGLRPVRLINTHCHLDHMFGNKYVSEKYNLGLEIHKGELPVLQSAVQVGLMYGVPVEASPAPSSFLDETMQLKFGNTTFDILFTPGHSPASISFYNKEENYIIGGDVLFYESIGRTDLPGGDHNTLLESIRTQFFTLDDDIKVYSGHGPVTTIGHEKKNNPFLN